MRDKGVKRQTDLADLAGIRPLTVNRVIKARGPLTQVTAEKLAPVLGTSVAYLLFGATSPGDDGGNGKKTVPAVRQYLTSDFGGDTPEHVARLLEMLDFASIGMHHPTQKDVHRVREMIEINLSIARQKRG